MLYFNRVLFSHGNITEANLQREAGYLSSSAFDYVRPENLATAQRAREDYRDMTMGDIERMAERMPWGTADEIIDKIIADAEHAGANTVTVSLNRGAMPHELFMNQIRRFAREVLPALQRHEVKEVPLEDRPLAAAGARGPMQDAG